MKITPLDIQKKQFPAKFRGVDKEDVHSFLELVREEMEKLLRENASLREEVQSTEKQLQDYKDMESAVRNMLIATQQMAEGYKNNAQKEAEVIKKEAELQTYKIEEAQKKVIKIHEDIT
ncbi:MAG: DivIVA domain-containing protein, partial [Nitrospirota bacterium]